MITKSSPFVKNRCPLQAIAMVGLEHYEFGRTFTALMY